MTRRKLYLDRAVGETRGVVEVDGRPERLLIAREGEPLSQQLGARSVARVQRIDRTLAMAFLVMADGLDGVLPLSRGIEDLHEGLAIEIEVTAEARRDRPRGWKAATAGYVAHGSGAPRLLEAAAGLEAQLRAWAPEASLIEDGEAREAADAAQDAALAMVHPLPGGGSLCIEATRALVAVDVDLGSRPGADARRAASQANLAAIREAARLLRLKGLGGLVVIDLVGKGHDGKRLSEAAAQAFAPEGAGVGIGPISRFGLFELSVPRGAAPVADRLLDDSGLPSYLTVALAMLRAMEREGRADPGGRIGAWCGEHVVEAAQPYLPALAERLGGRFQVEARPSMERSYEVAKR